MLRQRRIVLACIADQTITEGPASMQYLPCSRGLCMLLRVAGYTAEHRSGLGLFSGIEQRVLSCTPPR